MSASRARSKRHSYQIVVDQDDVPPEQTELDEPATTPRHGSSSKDTAAGAAGAGAGAKSLEKQFVEEAATAAVLTRSKSRAQTIKPILPELNDETHCDGGRITHESPTIDIPIIKVDSDGCSLIDTYLLKVERWVFYLSGCDAMTSTLKKLFPREERESDGTTLPPSPPPTPWAVEDAMYLVVLVAHFAYVWYEVLTFLDAYYLQKQSPTLKDTTVDVQRYVIYSSYLLIDLVYPIAMVGLMNMQYTCDLMKERELSCFDKLMNTLRPVADKLFHAAWRRAFRLHLLYGVFHVSVLFGWLTTNKYPMSDVVFWSFVFGIPHALYPLLLTAQLTRLFLLCTHRVTGFRLKFEHNLHPDADSLWNELLVLRSDIDQLSGVMKDIIGFFLLSLVVSILLQAGAVFIFQGEQFSLVYMLLNSWCLIWTIYGAQYVQYAFKETADAIIHSDTSSCLGPLDSKKRLAIHLIISRDGFSPTFRAFSLFSLSTETLWSSMLSSFLSIGAVLWETFELKDKFFKPNTMTRI